MYKEKYGNPERDSLKNSNPAAKDPEPREEEVAGGAPDCPRDSEASLPPNAHHEEPLHCKHHQELIL
jgi:hypothetical protein